MIKLVCPECDFVARASQKCIDMGLPVHCGVDMELADGMEDADNN